VLGNRGKSEKQRDEKHFGQNVQNFKAMGMASREAEHIRAKNLKNRLRYRGGLENDGRWTSWKWRDLVALLAWAFPDACST
jgi:hypothetical protein